MNLRIVLFVQRKNVKIGSEIEGYKMLRPYLFYIGYHFQTLKTKTTTHATKNV